LRERTGRRDDLPSVWPKDKKQSPMRESHTIKRVRDEGGGEGDRGGKGMERGAYKREKIESRCKRARRS
jgi:hypothetical protein